MGLLDAFKKKKKQENVNQTNMENPQKIDELAQICGNDEETYVALVEVMFLDPRNIEVSLKEAVENAKKFEKAKDFANAASWYKIAGGLAIYEGDVKKVVEYFSACEKYSHNKKFIILKNPEKAVEKAQEYYKKILPSKPLLQ
ncbi:MAG: hypothetical protein QW270_00745 [Candidatus Bathyarchaeia archaeon]